MLELALVLVLAVMLVEVGFDVSDGVTIGGVDDCFRCRLEMQK